MAFFIVCLCSVITLYHFARAVTNCAFEILKELIPLKILRNKKSSINQEEIDMLIYEEEALTESLL